MSNYEKFFDLADADGSGSLDLKEMIKILASHGYNKEDIEKMFEAADLSGDGKVTKQEYLIAMGECTPEQHSEATLRRAFRGFDKDNTGEIEVDDIKKLAAEQGDVISPEMAERFIKQVDADGSGTISYEEFITHFFGK